MNISTAKESSESSNESTQLSCKNADWERRGCGSCQSCILSSRLSSTTEWFLRADESLKTRFLSGIFVRCQSVGILKNTERLLQATLAKEFTYARSLHKPTKVEHSPSRSSDQELDFPEIKETWKWFSCSQYWVKTNYIIGLLSLCNVSLLHILGDLIRVLTVRSKLPFLHHDLKGDALAYPSGSVSWGQRNETLQENWWRKGGTAGSLGSEDSMPTVSSRFSQVLSGASCHRDFIRRLPVHLAKRILGLLDPTSLHSCRSVSQHWCYLTEEVQLDISTKEMLDNRAMIMQGSTCLGLHSGYAKMREVLVPIRKEEKHPHHEELGSKSKQGSGFVMAYKEVQTRVMQMEERNIYCGIYEIQVLSDQEDPTRVVDYCGGELVAMGSKDRLVRLLDTGTARAVCPALSGHAGSIHAVLLCEERGLVVSAGYDLSIRCWNLKTGVCTMLLCGHTGTINCLDLHDNRLVSGAKDCRVKVWNIQTGRCCENLKFKHRNPVLCVKMNTNLVLSGCEKGLVKMWGIDTASLIKMIDAHQGPVRCLAFDQWHILSGGADGYAMAWSTNGDFKPCLMTYRHPREVMTLAFLFLRVITGCTDGKIRIFGFLSGDCLRVIRVNSQQSPVLSLHVHDDNILVNTTTNMLLLRFRKVLWDYLSSDRELLDRPAQDSPKSSQVESHPHAGAVHVLGSSNQKIYRCVSGTGHSTSGLHMEQAHELQRRLFFKHHSTPSSRKHACKRSLSAPCCANLRPDSAITTSKDWHMAAEWVLSRSERAVSDRIRKRGPHHGLTPERVLLTVNAALHSQRCDPASRNMDLNAGVRDAWCPQPGLVGKDPVAEPSSPCKQQSHLPFARTVSIAELIPHPRAFQVHTGLGLSGIPPQQNRVGQQSQSVGWATKANPQGVGDFITTTKPTSASPPRILQRLHRKCVESDLPKSAVASPSRQSCLLNPFRQHSPFKLLTSTQVEDV